MTDVASTAEFNEVLTRARRWYVAWLLTWTGVLGYMLITADPAFLTANRLVPLAVVHVALLTLAIYLTRGLKQGRRVGTCAALAGFLSFANATGCMASMGITVTHRWPWSIPLVLALHAVVAAIAAVMLLRARGMQS